MRKFFYLLCVTAAFFSCSGGEDSGLQDDVNKLKERLDAIEKGKMVINVEFLSANMIITYSSGEKVTLPLPNGLNGINGTNGKDGVGITSIIYNESTSILKITLTNGNVSEFKIVTSGGSLNAVLLSDVNGSFLLSSAYLGNLNIASISYNDQNKAVSIINNVVADRQQVKNKEVVHEYNNGLLVSIREKSFAKSNMEHWDYSYYYEPYTNTANPYITDSQLSVGSSVESVIIKISDKEAILGYNGSVITSTKRSDGKWNNVIRFNSYKKFIYVGVSKIGDILSDNRYSIVNDSKGLMSSITLYRNGATVPEYQLRLSYNTASRMVKSEKFVMVNNAWTSTGKYLGYEYNSTNQLTVVKRFYPNGTSEKVQETVYDKNGNPTEIYSLQDAVYVELWDGWYNPETNTIEYDRLIKPAGFRLLAKFEYDYQLKNFFGNTVSAINPLLANYNIVNAIKRAWTADEYGLNGWIEYSDYDEFGYPKIMDVKGVNAEGECGLLEFRLTYQKKK